jgi:enoyl-CoA hydratase
MTQDPVLSVERSEAGFAVLTMNRPRAMNALSRQLRQALTEAIERLQADPQVRVLIITGAGRAFCAGLDLKELGGGEPGSAALAVEAADPVRALARFSGPVIGAINGPAITGGFELALACDVLLASTQAQFADTHARVGVMPGWGLSQRLSRIIGIYRAKELSLTGNFLSARQALEWGLVNRVVEPDDLLPQARALALDMLSVVPQMLVDYKKLIDDGYAASFGQAMTIELERARAANVRVSADDIERRRGAIRERGHAQALTPSRRGTPD